MVAGVVDPSLRAHSHSHSHCTNNPFALYIFSFIVISLSSGLVYGFPHLRNSLYSDGSTLSESELGIVYTIGAWTVQGGRFFSGIARDKFFGTKYTTTICLICAATGMIGLAYCNPNSIFALSTSYFLVGLGSGGQLCLQPVASLFHDRWQGTILASLSGAFQVSGLVFLVLVQITPESSGRGRGYFSFAIILFGLAVSALFLLPRHHFVVANNGDGQQGGQNEDTSGRDSTSSIDGNTNANDVMMTELRNCDVVLADPQNDKEVTILDEEINSPSENKFATSISSLLIVDRENIHNEDENHQERQESDVEDDKNTPKDKITIFQLLKSTEYILLICWFSVLIIPLQYYIGTIGFQLERKGDSDGTYTNLFSTFYALAAIFSPALGKIGDTFGLGCSQLIATLLTAVSLLILTSNQISLNVHLIGIACYSIGRMTVFGMFFTNVGKRFGYTHYGSLAGLGLLISAIFSLLQYPLIDIAARGREYEVNIICGCAILILGVPYCLWLGLRERSEKETSII